MMHPEEAPLPDIEEEDSLDLKEESQSPPRMTIHEFCDAFICTAREQGAPMDLLELLEEHAQFIRRAFAMVDADKARAESVMYKKSMASLMLNYMHTNRSEIEADSVKTAACGPRSKVPQMNVCISRATLFWIVAGLLILSSWAYAYGRAFKPSTTGHMVRSNDIHSHKVVVGKSSIHGWGVFAARDIHKGEVVEAAPVISDSHAATSSKMMDYVMSISDDEVAYGFGYFTFYNDSPDPDAYFEIDKDLGIVRVVANRHIPAGKEVFMSYGEKYWSTRDIVKK